MRYAVYYTPDAHHPLSHLAAWWLGRDMFTQSTIETHHGLDKHLASPRKYGFHGTLKAPFHLADDVCEQDLFAEFDRFAARQAGFIIPQITLARLGSFFALVPSAPDTNMRQLADEAVKAFEPMRAPLTAFDIARRNLETLTERQREHLKNWGYPYVMDEFRFHMTLTDKISEDDSAIIESALRHHFAPIIDQPLAITSLGLFTEQARGEPFSLVRIAALL